MPPRLRVRPGLRPMPDAHSVGAQERLQWAGIRTNFDRHQNGALGV